MRRIFFLVSAIALMAVACKRKAPAETLTSNVGSGVLVRNNIRLEQNGGVAVTQAFMLSGNGSLLQEDNKVNINEPVELRIFANGWKGNSTQMIALGAAEKITTDDGTVALDNADIFNGQPDIPVEKAEMIRLNAVVSKQEKKYNYYQITFKIWNKKDTAQFIKGSYRLYIK